MPRNVNLAELIRQHQDTTGESYADIGKKAGLSKAKIGQLAKSDSPHMPRATTLEKLARGLHMPMHVIQQAAMVTAGIDPDPGDPDNRVTLLAARLRDLSPDDFERVELFVLALAGRRE